IALCSGVQWNGHAVERLLWIDSLCSRMRCSKTIEIFKEQLGHLVGCFFRHVRMRNEEISDRGCGHILGLAIICAFWNDGGNVWCANLFDNVCRNCDDVD